MGVGPMIGLVSGVMSTIPAHWRMTRMQKVIRAHTDRAAYEHPSKNPMIAMADVMLSPEVAKLQRYENTFRRAYEGSWAKLKELQRKRASEQNEPKSVSPPPPVVRNEPEPRSEFAVAAAADRAPIANLSSGPPEKR